MTDRASPRPWKAAKPVHSSDGWRVTISSGPIVTCKAFGVTRSHAMANAALIVEAVNALYQLNNSEVRPLTTSPIAPPN